MKTWINFTQSGTSVSGKTYIWNVIAKESGQILGTISWFGRWRKYVFEPGSATVYEEDCLRDIATFIENATKAHRAALPWRKE